MNIVVMTSNKYDWALRGFFHQWGKYADVFGATDVIVAGYRPPPKEVFKSKVAPDFYKIGEFEDYPAHRWSDSLIKVLDEVADDFFILLLEDYWLIREVNTEGFEAGWDFMMVNHEKALRFDLTSDRLYAKHQDVFSVDSIDIIQSTELQYSLSTQAAIWNKGLLRRLLIPNETPWAVEMNGTGRFVTDGTMDVYGTRQWPMRYQIMIDKGDFKKNGGWLYPPRNLSVSDMREIEEMKYDRP
jgi:hypothetical protein